MQVRVAIVKTIGVLSSIALFATSGALAWAATEDYAARARVPMGVTLTGGRDLGGMTASEVRRALLDDIAASSREPLTVTADGQTFTLDLRRHLTIDIEGAVASAFEPVLDSAINQRVWRTLADEPVYHDIEPAVSVDRESLASTVRTIAASVYRPAVDATITIESGAILIRESVPGRSTDVTVAVSILERTLLAGGERVTIPVDPVPPAVSETDLGRTIVVSLRSRTLKLYDGVEVSRTYRVAVGKPGYSTPRGSWEIVQKRYRPTWGNPGSAWAAEMPRFIPPGPGNPLGTRALNLSVPGIRIHGTSNVASIGTAASHGCIRMVRRDVEELYDLVDVGTRVLIVR